MNFKKIINYSLQSNLLLLLNLNFFYFLDEAMLDNNIQKATL
jgi:hypothetical protein